MSERNQPDPGPEKSGLLNKPTTILPYIVGIGASAGGLEALDQFFGAVGDNPGCSFVVVQHLSPDFESHMEELLGRRTRLPVHQVRDGVHLEEDSIYLIPPGKTLIISDGRLLLTEKEKGALTYPIDVFLRSLASEAQEKAVAIILSGTGADGSRGVVSVHKAGGLVMVQDQEEADFSGMPVSAISTGIVDVVLPAARMPEALNDYFREEVSREDLRQRAQTDLSPKAQANATTLIFDALQERFGIDFTQYKPGTITRRIERRLEITNSPTMEAYAVRLADEPMELESLYRDLLIGVTRFFRDPDAFKVLADEVVLPLVQRQENEIRVWVAGCASGEEAYSLAILFHEAFHEEKKAVQLKIFATDAHADSVRTAAKGHFAEEFMKHVSPERRDRFFIQEEDGWTVSREIRRSVVFTQHNLAKTAPFTRLDLVTCRNLLIYLKPFAQRRVFSYIHFGIKTDGYLFLGPSESLGDLAEEFTTVSSKWNIFRKRRDIRLTKDFDPKTKALPFSPPVLMETGTLPPQKDPRWSEKVDGNEMLRTYDSLLERYMPPGVLLDETLRIQHVFAGAERFLRIPLGRSSHSFSDLIHSDIRSATNCAINRCIRERQAVTFDKISFVEESQDFPTLISVLVEPYRDERTGVVSYLITFIEEKSAPLEEALSSPDGKIQEEVSRGRYQELEQELHYTRENLQATIEELQATNEELVTSNEELQSSNEELHSVNEELDTVNREFQIKIDELIGLTDDNENMFAATQIGILFLDTKLMIRKFSPAITETFNILPSDVGRKITSFVHPMAYPDFERDLISVLVDARPIEKEIELQSGGAFLLRISPYQSQSISGGLIVSVIDITSVIDAERRVHELSEVIQSSNDAIIGMSFSGAITSWNRGAMQTYGYTEQEAIGRNMVDLVVPRENAAEFITQLSDASQGKPTQNIEMTRITKSGQEMIVSSRFSTATNTTSQQTQISSIERVITDEVQSRKEAQLLADVINATTDFVGICDTNLRGHFINQAGRNITMMPEGQKMSETTVDYFHPPEAMDFIQKVVLPAARRDGNWTGRNTLQRSDGSLVAVSQTLNIHRDDEGNETFYSTIMRDLTKEDSAREEFTRVAHTLSGVIENFPEMLLVLDREKHITIASPAARVFVEEHPEYKKGSLPLGLDAIVDHVLATGAGHLNNDFSSVAEMTDSDGNTRSYLRLVALLGTDVKRAPGVVIILQDVTEFRMLDEIKTDLIGTVSHELKNPVAAITMGLGMTLEGDLGPVDDIQRQVIQTAYDEAERIGRTINTLLDLSRFEDGKNQLILRPEAIPDIIQECLSNQAQSAAKKNISLETSMKNRLPMVECDASRLSLVLDNLLSNAIKYSPEGAEVIVSAQEEEDGYLTIRVSDNGPGIPDEYHDRVFKKFFRIPSQFGGSGLGLNISQRYIEAHHGTLQVEPSDQGATFTIRLPLQQT